MRRKRIQRGGERFGTGFQNWKSRLAGGGTSGGGTMGHEAAGFDLWQKLDFRSWLEDLDAKLEKGNAGSQRWWLGLGL